MLLGLARLLLAVRIRSENDHNQISVPPHMMHNALEVRTHKSFYAIALLQASQAFWRFSWGGGATLGKTNHEPRQCSRNVGRLTDLLLAGPVPLTMLPPVAFDGRADLIRRRLTEVTSPVREVK